MINNLSSNQRKLLLQTLISLGIILILWVIFAPTHSTVHYLKTQNELKAVIEENKRLAQENQALQEEIDRLVNDREYLEKIAREQYGLVRKNEIIFEFESKKKDREE